MLPPEGLPRTQLVQFHVTGSNQPQDLRTAAVFLKTSLGPGMFNTFLFIVLTKELLWFHF